MRPKQLTLCGWGPYKSEEHVDFTVFEDKGIFLITGATGAGKTTIFDAISYALYGALSGEERDKEKGSVRSDFADAATPTFVELVMEHGGKIYRIRRNPEYLRPRKRAGKSEGYTKEKENAILYYPDERILEGVREVNAALRELLVLDYRQFKKISMIAQGEFARLLVAPPKDKTGIFREIFDTGVCERFTQSLGVRARAAYNRVAEQKHKLEEDVRLLTEGLEKAAWSQETKAVISGLTEGKNPNFSAIHEQLVQLRSEAEEVLKEKKKLYERIERQLEQQAAELTRLQEENQRILQFQQVCMEKERLETVAAEYERKQEIYSGAVNAAEVEKQEERTGNLERQLAANLEEAERLQGERRQLGQEAEELCRTVEQAEEIRSMLELRKAEEEVRTELTRLQKELAGESERLKRQQQDYLHREECYGRKQADWEDAERKRRLNLIGLTAELLKEGEPCPVCGSVHHPSPAGNTGETISEETLGELKEAAEAAKTELMELHKAIAASSARKEAVEGQRELAENRLREMKGALSAFSDRLEIDYFQLPVQKAAERLQKRCDRASRIAGLIQEKDNSLKRHEQNRGRLQEELSAAREAFEEALAQYGFRDRADYIQAKRSGAQRETLRAELEAYRMKVAGNQELYLHLEGTISEKEPFDLTEPTEKLDILRKERDNVLKEQKLWESQFSEVGKTAKVMGEKLEIIDRESREYGYVKDLENMASGNNSKRLVFEQYVLAGYFEEILRAANLRFARMTGGRYEMSRVEQVGDGRVKDNLEIQVMDYYTGKYRSVRTLSGGESFKASLALALGMSDVIQAMNGGIRVDTLFVDEGFGALDSESLDQACDTLMSLVEKKQLIGIISHVPELRERIDNQLVIEKTGSGSRIKCR